MRSLLPIVPLLVISSMLLTTSCEKRKLNRQTTTAEDNALAEDLFDDVFIYYYVFVCFAFFFDFVSVIAFYTCAILLLK